MLRDATYAERDVVSHDRAEAEAVTTRIKAARLTEAAEEATEAARIKSRLGRAVAHLRMWTKVRAEAAEWPKLPKIHCPPGFKLLSIAEFLFSPKTYTEVLEPTLRDLQVEHTEALSTGRLGKARWVQLRGYCSFWSAVIALGPASLLKRLTELWKAVP